MQVGGQGVKREQKGMVRRGGKRQQRKDGRAVRAGEAYQQGNGRQVDKGRNTSYQNHTSGIWDTLCVLSYFITVLIHAFCAMLLLLCAIAQQILLNRIITSWACTVLVIHQGSCSCPSRLCWKLGKRGKKRNCVLQDLMLFQALEPENR